MAQGSKIAKHLVFYYSGDSDVDLTKLYGSSIDVERCSDSQHQTSVEVIKLETSKQMVKEILEKEASAHQLTVSAEGKANTIVAEACRGLGMSYATINDSGIYTFRTNGSYTSSDANTPHPASDAIKPLPASDAIKLHPESDASKPYPASDASEHDSLRGNVAFSQGKSFMPATSSVFRNIPGTKIWIQEDESLLKACFNPPRGHIVACLGNRVLRDTDLQCLMGNNWLNIQTVDAFFEVQKKKYRDVTCIGTSRSFDAICQEGRKIVHRREGINIIIAPKLENSHFTLVILRPKGRLKHLYRLHKKNMPFVACHSTEGQASAKDSSLEFFNSCGGEEHATEDMLPYVRRLLGPNWEMLSYKHPLQEDGYNCGVYICWYAMCVVRGEYSKIKEPLTSERLDELRSYIRKEILQSSDDITVCAKCAMEFRHEQDEVDYDEFGRWFHRRCL